MTSFLSGLSDDLPPGVTENLEDLDVLEGPADSGGGFGDLIGGLFPDDLDWWIIFPLIIGVGFLVVFGGFAVLVLRGLIRWARNNSSPVQTVPASVLAKRGDARGGGDSPVYTSYFIAFELKGGERIEFPVSGSQYGVVLEGERGALTYQGTRFKGFDPTPQDR